MELPRILAKAVTSDFNSDKQITGIETNAPVDSAVPAVPSFLVEDSQILGIRAKETVPVIPPFLVEDSEMFGIKEKNNMPWLIAAGILIVWSVA